MRRVENPGATSHDVRTGTLGAAIGEYPALIALMTLGGLAAGIVIAARLGQLLRATH